MADARPAKTLADLSEKMRDIDFAMLSTHTEGGAIAARPMSNNREVEYDGAPFISPSATRGRSPTSRRDPQVGLSFLGKSGLLGHAPVLRRGRGRGRADPRRAQFAEHWTSDLDRWFADGIDTPGLVLIKVRAARVHYWDGEDEGEIRV